MAVFYKEADGRFVEVLSLWDALCMEAIPHSVISLVGAGGKTSTMFRLARECRAMGKRVIVTTSTHIACPDDDPVVLVTRAEELENLPVLPDFLVVAGSKDEEKRKLAGLSVDQIGKLKRYCDVLLIEADGSRQMPFKIPADHEPVIIPETEVVIGCAGLSAVGACWKDKCFRWQLSGQADGDARITAQEMARILADDNGTRKQVGNRPYRVVLNQADGSRQLETACEIAVSLKNHLKTGETPVIAASCYL